MFESARLKLTFWYLLIIMLVSMFFSVMIYRVVIGEIEEGFARAEQRLKARELGFRVPVPTFIFFDDLASARHRVIGRLVSANAVIFLGSAAASYFLAGKTLHPIKEALEIEKRFVADASHELKTPLTALKSSIEVALRDRNMTITRAKKVLQVNLEEVDELETLSENLLSLSRMERPHHRFHFLLVDTNEVLATVKRRLGTAIQKKGISLKLPDSNIQFAGDEESIVKVMTVLIDNAVKYTPAGGTVTVDSVKQKNQLQLTVADTGAGIAKKDLPYIFDRFYRVDTARTKTVVSGHGLGLAIANQIVKLHNGTITVESDAGNGSTFTVILPLSQPKPL